MRRLVLLLLCCVVLGGCAARPPRCTGKLEPINGPDAQLPAEAADGN